MNIHEIPHLKAYKQRVYLPTDPKASSLYNVGFINNITIDGSISVMNHPLLNTRQKYMSYFLETIYREKIGIKAVNKNFRIFCDDVYKQMDGKFKLYSMLKKFDMYRTKNVYYDLMIYNKIFFENISTGAIEKRISMYFDYLEKTINSTIFNPYKNKFMLIDIEDWMKYPDQLNNPIMYFYLAFRKYFYNISKLGNIDIILVSDSFVLRINPSLCTPNDFNIFKRELNRLYKSIDFTTDSVVDEIIHKEEIKSTVNKTIDNTFRFTGSETEGGEDIEEDENLTKLKNKLSNELIKNKSSDNTELPEGEIEKKVTDKLSTDEELVKQIHSIKMEQKTGKTTASNARDVQLRKIQKDIVFKGMALQDYIDKSTENTSIEVNDISNNIISTNDNMKKVKFNNFEKSYNENLMTRDTVSILMNLNDKSIPVYIKSIESQDTSNELNYKETYTITLEDENRVVHRLSIDMPKFLEDKYLYLNGNQKIITKQLFMKPIVKTGPDEVQVCSNYNKIFINRVGHKMSPKIEKFKKLFTSSLIGVKIIKGDNSSINNQFKTIIEYDELAKTFSSIKKGTIEIIFDQNSIKKKLEGKVLKEDEFCVGFNGNDPIIMSYKTEKINDGDLIDYIISNFGPEIEKSFNETSSGGKKFMYSQATIMSKHVPIILLLGYCEGLTTVLKKANIKHYFTDKRPSVNENEEGVIKFEDGYLVYDKYPFENSLLLNGLDTLPTRSFSYEEFDERDVYVELFDILYNARNLANAFNSFYEFMIDPITKEVLEDLGYPTDFVNVIIFANALLADNSYIIENNANLYRVRSNEIVNALLHKEIADAYGRYRASSNSKHPEKMSIQRDAIIKKLQMTTTVEERSILNPIYDIEKTRAITPKGVNGLNLENAYTQDKRSYDPSLLGLVGMSTSNDANVGVVRKLTLEPNIINARGYIDISDDVDALNDVNLFTPAELLTPIGSTRDDSIRTAMSSKQSGHIIPITKSSPVLISNGAEQIIQYNISDSFTIIAEDNGEVVDIDTDAGFIVVKYKNGKHRAIDISSKIAKNSASGFYFSNKLKCNLKIGQKIKKNDILAYDDKFFSDDKVNGNRFNLGSLQKIAVMSSYSTYEDSTFITKKLSNDMSAEIVMMIDANIGRNSSVDAMVDIGDKVDVGDILISSETSYDEEGYNKFLSTIGAELQEEINSLIKVPIKSKYSGTIEDIKIYCSCDMEDLSPSLQKIMKKYYAKVNKKKKLLTKYDPDSTLVKAGILFNEAGDKIEPDSAGKIKGKEVDGILIEFYIKYYDPMGVGDKLTFYSPLKSIIGEVIAEGYEPFSDFRQEEEVSSFIGPSAILQRMTPSILIVLFGNKVLVELKNSLKDIYNS